MVDPKSVAKKPDNEATLKQEEPPSGDPTNQADGEHPVFEFVNSMTGPPTLDLNESGTARPPRPTMEINKSKTPKEMLRNYCAHVVRHIKWEQMHRYGRDVSDPRSPYAGLNFEVNESTSEQEVVHRAAAAIRVHKREEEAYRRERDERHMERIRQRDEESEEKRKRVRQKKEE